jgi:hypothetical protein
MSAHLRAAWAARRDNVDEIIEGLTEAQRLAVEHGQRHEFDPSGDFIIWSGSGIRMSTIRSLWQKGLVTEEPVLGYSRSQGGDTWGNAVLTPLGVKVLKRLRKAQGRAW